jgi:hypothetical protein
MSEQLKIKIEDGTIVNPKHDSHKRAKNWVAIVERDKSKPGGLKRDFLERAPAGRVFVGGIKPGDWLEFAGDYYSCSGRKSPDRDYVRVIEVNGDLVCKRCEKNDIGKQDETEQVNPLATYSEEELTKELLRRKPGYGIEFKVV